MSKLIWIVATALIGVATVDTLHAEVSQGDRVRITRIGGIRVVGYLESSDAAELKLRTDAETHPITIPTREVTMAEVSLGTHGHAKQGAIIGGVVGFLFGTLAVTAEWWEDLDLFRVPETDYGLWVGCTLGGVLVGAAIGHAIRWERWRQMWKHEFEASGARPAGSP
jgi:hypothetical protein